MDRAAVAIVGAGPAGIFAALTLTEAGLGPVTLVEQGRSIEQRRRSRRPDILTGWGGAGAFSDGKLTLSPEVGGFLSEIVPPERLAQVMARADEVWQAFGAPRKAHAGTPEEIEDLETRAKLAGMIFLPSPVRHTGTETCRRLLADVYTHLAPRCRILTGTRASRIRTKEGQLVGLELEDGRLIETKRVICAPGRVGNEWMRQQAQELNLAWRPNPVDIGVRVEAPAPVLTCLTETFYEPKLIYYTPTFDDRVRTFCMNPAGEVVIEKNHSLITVNGHSYARRKTGNTNFALLVSATFTEPFDDPIAYGRSIARLANLLGEGAIVQRLGDLQAGRRTTPARLARCLTRPTLTEATPGDLSYVLPYRILRDIIEMIEAVDRLAPGLADRHTLLYGVEVKFYSNRIELNQDLETAIGGLQVIGDGAGVTRGLLQASASGIIAAEAILADSEKTKPG